LAATTEPSATPVTLAFEPPDDILPPNSIVMVVVDELQLRGGPGLDAGVVGAARAGSRFFVLDVFGPVVADGLDWYRLTTAGDSVLWAAAGSGADRFLEVVPPDCPAEPALANLINMLNEWDRLACFGDHPLTFDGTYGCPIGCGGTTPGVFEPMWLAFPSSLHLLGLEFPTSPGYLEMRVAPDSELEIPMEGSIVRVTGHFSDPASASCKMTFDDAMAVDPRTAELRCRERFVVDAFEVIGTDPDAP
jgi:hypothetical protein